jgi:signal transduction histidine kinase
VRDTGPGIAPADQQRVFEPFEQLDPVRRKHVPGVGLGLALVHAMVTALGGTISLESAVGQGSAFTVTLEAGDG